jgi:hypothetical protein
MIAMLSTRSLIAFAQLAALQTTEQVELLFRKHGVEYGYTPYDHLRAEWIAEVLGSANEEQVVHVVSEFVRLQDVYRRAATPRTHHELRLHDFGLCLFLDGYRWDEDGSIHAVDPTLIGTAPIEDDLTAAIRTSGLPSSAEMVRLLASSVDHFRATPPDYNASLTDARVALETIAREMAANRRTTHAGNYDPTSWGQIVAYLRTSGLITRREEDGFTGVYSFISQGAHIPVGITEQEMVRLGRNLAAGMSYLLIKKIP